MNGRDRSTTSWRPEPLAERAPDTRYSFGIRGGVANAANGDFTMWSGPQSLELTHTQGFTFD